MTTTTTTSISRTSPPARVVVPSGAELLDLEEYMPSMDPEVK
jgi:hypothetical protein